MVEKKKDLYSEKSPCKTCPYRRDAKIALWSIEEFKDLLKNDRDFLGGVYLCHKKDGSICVGFLMNQDERGFPCIALRMSLSSHNVDREFLDALHCDAERFESIEEMCVANFPELEDFINNLEGKKDGY